MVFTEVEAREIKCFSPSTDLSGDEREEEKDGTGKGCRGKVQRNARTDKNRHPPFSPI